MIGSPPRFQVASPPASRPLLIYDGGCGFCRLWVVRWLESAQGRLDAAPSQEAAGRFPEIPSDLFQRTVVLVELDGTATSGAEAVFRSLAFSRRGRFLYGLYRHFPGFAPLSEIGYGFVASRRVLFSRITRLLWGSDVGRPSYSLSSSLYLRLIGLVYLIAFISLWVQIEGLAGSQGILPAASYLEAVSRSVGAQRYWLVPTLLWLDSSDFSLHVICAAGTLLSALLLFGLAPLLCLILLWVLYLSLTVVCGEFLGFQWDNLLLEAGFLAILMPPAAWRLPLAGATESRRLAQGLTRWLLFRLMFASGLLKLTSGDPAWRDLTALTFHYETQPLPPWTAWYAHQLPLWLHKTSIVLMFAVELLAPLLIAAPRRARHLGAAALAGLQSVIIATGNYGFFNLLSLAMCLLLVEDAAWPSYFRRKLAAARAAAATRRRRWIAWALAPLAATIVVLSLVEIAGDIHRGMRWPAPIRSLHRLAAPFRSVNGYGLFRVMTRSRPEIIVEGSRDGSNWTAYEFRWKPGDPARRPAFVAPHMPRLDWQMWFAALSSFRQEHWVANFMARLLEGSPPVLRLLESNPFEASPPRYIRAVLYDYRFTDFAARRNDGSWWRRQVSGPYSSVLSLRRDPGESRDPPDAPDR